ncbi:type IX secretion system outer membrane channel protein PorV [Flavobacterium sp. JP2137]|uniref:type IX secretion system outer membrane channel protein PorV n=1 Tax=Flavobacterium sp. JP2137 TaxID=3414510 RepID=UPI003D3000E8
MKKTTIVAMVAISSQFAVAQNSLPVPANYQDSRAITTGVPFLQIAADARSAGMGDMGVATTTDIYSQQHNPAKYAFATQQQGFAISYTPYMTSIASDVSLGQLNYFNKFNERSAFAVSMRYFGLGDIELRQNYNDAPITRSPNEFAIDGSYSLKLTEKFSMAVAGRFISSNLKVPEDMGGGDASAATTFAVDIAGFYESEQIAFNSFEGRWRAGFNLQNLGPKIKYDDSAQNASFLPSNLKLGGGFDFILDAHNTVTVYGELNKLLVPTPQIPDFRDLDGDGVLSPSEQNAAITKSRNEYNDIGWASGIFKSFGDAPGGMSEEMKEFTWALGAEYWYDDAFAFRVGYFNENELKGARKYATLGAGFKYNTITVDVSYLFSTSKVNNPLENTLRFSLAFNFGGSYSKN